MNTKNIIALLSILLISACAPAAQESAEPFKIGIIVPLTGPNAWIGGLFVPAAELARDEINADGGINGRIIEFIIEDSDNAQKASTAATKLVMQDEVDVLYPITTPVVAAASAVAEQNQVLAFGFTSVQTFAKKNTWVFSDLRSVVQECTMLAATALKNGHTRLAFLGNDADFTVECREALENDFVGKGGAIVADEIKISNDPDARTIIAKIKQANPDALLLLCWPPDCNIIYKQMLELDFAPQFYLPVGIPLPANPASLKGIDKERILKDAYAGDQAINPENPTPELAAFIEKYEARLTKEPEHIADPAVVYDNMHEIAIAARKCEPLTNECLREKLSETDYVGAAGKVAFEGKHYTARPSRVVQYKDGKWVEP